MLQNPKADVSTGGGVFPTTLASAIFKEVEDGIQTTLIWAGDSRTYIFDLEKGLQQISKDDVIGEFDACFGKDCRMGNCISQDVDFKLNYATFILPKKCVLFVCSDGCFDFMPTPIHFEFEIMRALYSAQNLNESFEKSIRAMNAGDDCTMAGCVFNIEIPEFQAFIQKRIKYIAQMKNAIDTSDAIYEKYVEKNKVVRQDDEFWIGYCGSLSDSYDIPCVIDAVQYLDDPKVKLIVMGEGHLKDKFQKYAAHAGIHAEFTGYMNYSEMCGLLAACDITVNPIRGKSAASIINKHADYAACGLPVINTQNSAEYQKLIEIYHMGYSVKPGDYQMFACKLKELICNEKLREEMGKNSRRCAEEKFNRKHTYQELIKIIANKE